MGNCLCVMYNHISERYHVSHLSGILDQAIANNVNDVEKYQCKSVDVDRTVVSRLEKLMVIVRRQHSTPPWEDLLQMLLSMLMTRESIVETFCDVIANITRNFKMLITSLSPAYYVYNACRHREFVCARKTVYRCLTGFAKTAYIHNQ